jgi:serine/threonine protein kinase
LLDNRLAPDTILDKRYKICNLIKSGGMGAVYKAEDLYMDNRVVAIKEMLDSFATADERRSGIDNFLSEIVVLESFRHPNIPRVTDHFFQSHGKENFYYFVMEYIDGIDLSKYLKSYGSPGLPENQVIRWAIQVCEALDYLHSLEPPVAHRDIKSSNLIYRPDDGRVLIIDFGIARMKPPGGGFWVGTPGYAPPEQQLGKPEPRSDFYALAATMHELLTGIRPQDFNFASFKELGIEVSDDLNEFIEVSLNFNPDDRAVDAKEMKRFLKDILGEQDMGIGPLSSDYVFEDTIHDFKEKTLTPLLQNLIQKYGNEAHTKYLPKRLDYFVFTLACPTNFELIIRSSYKDRRIHFYEKQGILEKKEIGSLDPSVPQESQKASEFIEQFVKEYEKFKSANWGGGEGFIGFGNIITGIN